MATPEFAPDEYMVFEADQVLTNDHLNQLFNYLDQQNRWTRNKLLGIGIVCGLDIVQHTGVIEITKGCGVTSQGYLIVQELKQYTYCISYTAIDQPNDLPFTYPGDLPFYKPYCSGKRIYLLLTDSDRDALEPEIKGEALTISSATAGKILDDYTVVLFLEADETDLKNCDVFDCNNRGEKMKFQIRPLLVKKSELPGLKKATDHTPETKRSRSFQPVKQPQLLSGSFKGAATVNTILKAPEINLKRFNVPYSDLKTTDDIINAFARLVDDSMLIAVAGAYKFCYDEYSVLLSADGKSFDTLFNDLKTQRDNILKSYPVFIQYFYDFIDDLLKAYLEFRVKVSGLLSTCCPDENLFPLHLVLGEATANTKDFVKDPFRTSFIYSALFARQENEISESAFLLRRMQIMVSRFVMSTAEKNQKTSIKIIPGLYKQAWLSQRVIPYYYTIDEKGNELYKYWNYYKTVHGNAAFNLSYNAFLYNTNMVVTDPLLYDIERYNFFRIEGHIGLNYQSALQNILQQRKNYNLPFDVVAISADQLPAGTGILPQCNMQDLDTDFKLIISEFSCLVHTPFCFVTKLAFPPANKLAAAKPAADATQTFSQFKMQAAEKINVTQAVLQLSYKKGDFMRRYCAPKDGTIGGVYLNSLSNTGVFTNPVKLSNTNAGFSSYYYLFEFVDAVESLMQILVPSTLATLDVQTFLTVYKRFTNIAGLTIFTISQLVNDSIGNTENPIAILFKEIEMDILADEFAMPLFSCTDERLQTLMDEYKRRLQLYELQRSFFYYYNKRSGLEHKAGVPRSGTFVLVYHPSSLQFQRSFAIAETIMSPVLLDTGISQVESSLTDAKLFLEKKPQITPIKNTSKNSLKDVKAKAVKSGAKTAENKSAEASQSGVAADQPLESAINNITSLTTEALAGTTVLFETATVSEQKYLDQNTVTLIRNMANNLSGVTAENKKTILDFLLKAQVQFAPTKYSVADNVVIADFYVPYLCCSDCAPVAYVLPDITPPKTTVFDITPKEFLFDDAHNYAFTATPPVTGKGVQQVPFTDPAVANPGNLNLMTDAANILYLHPAMPELDKTTKATITYKTIPVELTILKPDAAFTISLLQGAAGQKQLKVEAANKDAGNYIWSVNGEETIFKNDPAKPGTPDPVDLDNIIKQLNAETWNISLTISYTRNNVTSEAVQSQQYSVEACVDFDTIKVNTEYGQNSNPVIKPGDKLFTTADKIIVSILNLRQVTGAVTFGLARVVAASPAFGTLQFLSLKSVNIGFDYSGIGFVPSVVEIKYLSQGGAVNFSVNGNDVMFQSIKEFPAQIKDIKISVTPDQPANINKGKITLSGPVTKFSIGGQEFAIDTVCAKV